jgi:hypothetical protein
MTGNRNAISEQGREAWTAAGGKANASLPQILDYRALQPRGLKNSDAKGLADQRGYQRSEEVMAPRKTGPRPATRSS